MSVEYYRGMCNRYKGRAVEIRTANGRVHHGIIQNVDDRRVYIRPLGGSRGFGGFGYGFGGFGGYGGFGPYGGVGAGFGVGIALGAITSLALLPFFFW